MITLERSTLAQIVNALINQEDESKDNYITSINNESLEGTQNSRHIHRWDYRYNTILEIAKKNGLEHGKIKRKNLWEAVYLIGSENEIYVFFSLKNMKTIIRGSNHNHYLKLLNFFNKSLDSLSPLVNQLSLLDDEVQLGLNEDEIALYANDVLPKMKDTPPSKVIIISFDNMFINTAKAIVFNSKQQIVWEEDLSELIEPDYKSVVNSDNINSLSKEKNVTLKVKQQIVKLKNNI